MVTAMDTEFGRILDEIALHPNTWVFFIGDNGTARMASEPPFVPMHAKGSLYEGGVNVPFIVKGPGVPIGRRLDFLLQELGRETNTIGSKGADEQVAHQIVELKTELERIREQVQNIE